METAQDQNILGRGWATPPTFIKGANQALMNEGELNVNENLKNLLDTRLLERPYRPLYGTNLHSKVFSNQSALALGELQSSLSNAIDENEPRVKLESVDIELFNALDSMLLIKVVYTIISVNTRHNFVYPFYLNEGTHINLNE